MWEHQNPLYDVMGGNWGPVRFLGSLIQGEKPAVNTNK